jgi:hypothetical protein
MSVNSYQEALQVLQAAFIKQTASSTNQRIQGTVFLYPLRAEWLASPSDQDPGPDASFMGDFSELFKTEEPSVLCLRVKAHSPEYPNWEAQGKHWLHGSFPRMLPIRYFLEKKEGDLVELPCTTRKKHFSLTCQQLGSRYERNNRTFENIMEEMFMVTYNNLFDQYQEGSLTAEEQTQWQIIDKMKQQRFPNSTVTSRGGRENCIVS